MPKKIIQNEDQWDKYKDLPTSSTESEKEDEDDDYEDVVNPMEKDTNEYAIKKEVIDDLVDTDDNKDMEDEPSINKNDTNTYLETQETEAPPAVDSEESEKNDNKTTPKKAQ